MPASQVWLLALLGLVLVAAVVVFLAVVRHAPRSRAAKLLGRGAFAEAAAGDERRARRRFEEVEASLESKLRADLAGDPLFAEWFLHAALLWRAAGDDERAEWAWSAGLAAAPASRLAEAVGSAAGVACLTERRRETTTIRRS